MMIPIAKVGAGPVARRSTWAVWTSAPHRMFFLPGALQLVATMLFMGWDIGGRALGLWATPVWSIPARVGTRVAHDLRAVPVVRVRLRPDRHSQLDGRAREARRVARRRAAHDRRARPLLRGARGLARARRGRRFPAPGGLARGHLRARAHHVHGRRARPAGDLPRGPALRGGGRLRRLPPRHRAAEAGWTSSRSSATRACGSSCCRSSSS